MRVRPQARAQAGARGGAASAARRVARPAQVGVRQGGGAVRQGGERRIAPLTRTRVGRRAASPQLRGGLALGNGRPVGSCGAASSRDRGRGCPSHRSEQRARHGRRRLTFPGATARGRFALGRAWGRQVAVAAVRRSGVLLMRSRRLVGVRRATTLYIYVLREEGRKQNSVYSIRPYCCLSEYL